MSSAADHEISSLTNTLSTLLNKQLQQICQVNGLSKNGVKAELQRRIVCALQETLSTDREQYAQIRASIYSMRDQPGRWPPGRAPYANQPVNSMQPASHTPQPQPLAPQYGPNYNAYNNYGRSGNGYGAGAAQPLRRGIQFTNSPFYTIETQIGEAKDLTTMTAHRNSVVIQLKTNEFPALHRCTQDPKMRVMIFCAESDAGVQEIAFPHQSELKVNGGDVKANLRGMKNKAGTTRPVDITSHLRLDKQSYTNNIDFTYALTDRKYYLMIFLCKIVPVPDLVQRIKSKKIVRSSVIQELNKAAHDPDVVATSQVLSLKCPISYMRLNTPCRSVSCNHIQCFDATSYLQLQEQGPQWLCPICNKPATFENLAIDEYTKDILEHTSESVEQVTIEPDGQWKVQETEEPASKKPRYSRASASVVDDDDVIPLDDFNFSARDTLTPGQSSMGTPASAANGSGARKRPAEVIDLTLSDDDDDEPIIRAPKRQTFGPTPNAHPPMPGYPSNPPPMGYPGGGGGGYHY